MAGINFRASSGYVADGAGETYSLGEAYPTTRGGLTFGFASNLTANSRNRSTGVDRRLAGCVFQVNSAGAVDFTLDLPNGPGQYELRLALGDAGSAQNQKCVIKDGATTLGTIEADTLTGQWLDAQGGIHFSSSGWTTDNDALTLTFATSTLVLTIGADPSATFSTALAHVSVVSLAVPSELSGGVTLDNATAAGTLGSSASDLSGGVALDVAVAAGTLGQAPGTINLVSLRNENNGPHGAITIPFVSFARVTDGIQVLVLAGVVLDAGSNQAITNGALVPGQWYVVTCHHTDRTKAGVFFKQAA